jgi:hypothetical protein
MDLAQTARFVIAPLPFGRGLPVYAPTPPTEP